MIVNNLLIKIKPNVVHNIVDILNIYKLYKHNLI